MILKKKQLAIRVGQACAAIAIAAGGHTAFAQETQRVEITGSSIKRVDAETALPVTVITRADIDKTGITTAAELLQSLPAMQGFQTASKSVNGGGGGATSASLHSIGTGYTLVLLNGRRLAPFTTGTSVNLDSIPLSMVERVEVLTDGASAIYGADAIAGVVNFITKSNSSAGELVVSANKPQHGGGETWNASITKGFGNLETDRFNIHVGFSAENQKQLWAKDREFSKSGYIPFDYNGQHVTTFLSSSNSIPGTVITSGNGTLLDGNGNDLGSLFFSPRLLEKGSCGAKTVNRGGVCRFDYSSTVQNIPESERQSFFATGKFKISDKATIFAEAGFSDFKTTPAFAPSAQPGIYLTQALVDAHITPHLATLGSAPGSFFPVGDPGFAGPTMNLRVYDAGPRTDEYRTKATHLVLGIEGAVNDIDYSASYTHSENKFTDTWKAGYLSSTKFNALVASGAFDPLAADIGSSVAVLAPAVLHQLFDQSKSQIDVLNLRASKPLWKMAGGDASGGIGYERNKQRFSDDPSPMAMGTNALQPTFTDTPIGGSSGALPFDSSRTSNGLFVELVMPVLKNLEVASAVRHDKYDAVKNSANFNAAGTPIAAATQGQDASSTTYKLSTRFQPIEQLLLRASLGTGFKAPTLASITQPVQAFGSTGFHNCPPGLPAAIAAACEPVSSEYNKRSGGNPLTGAGGLKPEQSKQWTVGFRVEPSKAFSFGADLWSVKLKDRIDVLPENVAFGNGATYAAVFSVLPDPITGKPTLTETESPANLGKARYKGVDLDAISTIKTPFGKLTTHGTATYMITSEYEVAGLPGYQTSLGKLGVDTEVTFRWLGNLSVSLESGAFTNTLNLQYKPSYGDAVSGVGGTEEVRVVNANGSIGGQVVVRRDVESSLIIDWQGKYAYSKAFTITAGIKNLFDSDPPFTIQAQDGTGNMRGYDGRYADPLGRQFYVSGNYKF